MGAKKSIFGYLRNATVGVFLLALLHSNSVVYIYEVQEYQNMTQRNLHFLSCSPLIFGKLISALPIPQPCKKMVSERLSHQIAA